MKFIDTEKELTQEEYQEFVSSQELNLPKSYENHILKNNGGRPSMKYYKNISIHYFHSIKYGEFGTLEENLDILSDVLPKGFFPFAEDSGGNQICISLNSDNYGYVYMWYHDMDDENDTILLESTFEGFINKLTDNDNY